MSLVLSFRRKYVELVSVRGWKRIELSLYILWRAVLLLILSFLIVVVTILLKIINPIVKIRIIEIGGDRIGSLADDAELYLRRQALYGKPKRELTLVLSGRPVNYQLLTMIKRRLFVLEYSFLLKIHKQACILMKNSKIWIPASHHLRAPHHLNSVREFNEVSPQLSFTEEERLKGKEELLCMGIKPGDLFVCFHSRDKAYLDRVHPYRSREEWAYHDFRDSDIRNYLSAAEYLTSLEIFAVRMGYIVEYPIKISNPRIVDYSVHYRSDFMDIYLLSNCKFFLGNNGGLNCVTQSFGVPVAAANWIPLSDTVVSKRDIFIPMKLWSIEKKRFLTFREIITSDIGSFLQTQQYTKAGIEVIENTADEILALVKEMNARLDNTWVTTQEDEELQKHYRSLFPRGYYPCEPPSRIGTEFLRQNRELLK